MAINYPINPRVRAYGKARLDIAQRAQSFEDWQELWKPPMHPFPFEWSGPWKQCVEYHVDDFAAEVGFFTDVLGFPVSVLNPGYAMFTSPQGDFYFSIVPTPQGEASTPPEALRLQFMLSDLSSTAQELEKRNIAFEQPPQPYLPGSSLQVGTFRTPHGIAIDLWGAATADAPLETGTVAKQQSMDVGRPNGDDAPDEEWDEDDKEPDEEDEIEEEDEADEDEAVIEEDEAEYNGNGAGKDIDEEVEEEDEELEIEEEDEEDDEEEDLEEDEDLDDDEDLFDEDEDDEDEFDKNEDLAQPASESIVDRSTHNAPRAIRTTVNSSTDKSGDSDRTKPEYIDIDAT